MPDEPVGDGQGGSGPTEPPAQKGKGGKKEPPVQEPPAQEPPVDDFKAKFEAAEAARVAAVNKLADALKGQKTDAERLLQLENDYATLQANFGVLKTTYDAEQNQKKVLIDTERTDLIAKLVAARPGLNKDNLDKCDILFLRDLSKNVLPPEPSAFDVRKQTVDQDRDKRIAALREQRKAGRK